MGEKAPRPVHIPNAAEAWKEIRDEDAEQGLREWDAEVRNEEHRKEIEALEGKVAEMEGRERRDALTGLPDRGAFFLALERALGERGAKPVAVIFADVNYLKLINDRFGHASGDSALQAAAEALRYAVRSTDVVARMSGDEFVILLPGADTATARAVVEKCRTVLAGATFAAGQERKPFSVSFGVASTDEAVESSALVGAADKDMYAAKEQKQEPEWARQVSPTHGGGGAGEELDGQP